MEDKVIRPWEAVPDDAPAPARSWRNLFRKPGKLKLPSLAGFLKSKKHKSKKESSDGDGAPKTMASAVIGNMMLFQRQDSGADGEMVGYGMEEVKEPEPVLQIDRGKSRKRCPVCTLPLPCGIDHPPQERKGFFGKRKGTVTSKAGAVADAAAARHHGASTKESTRPRIRVRSHSSSEEEKEEGKMTKRLKKKVKKKTAKHSAAVDDAKEPAKAGQNLHLHPARAKIVAKTSRKGWGGSGVSDSVSGSGYSTATDYAVYTDGDSNEGKDIVGRDNITEAQLEKIERAFKMFDRTNSGHVGKDQLVGVLRELGQPIKNEEELEELYVWADTDESGRISFDEIINLLVAKIGYRAASGVHFVVDTLKGFTMPTAAERSLMHGKQPATGPVKIHSTLTSRKPNKATHAPDVPPIITVRLSGGGAGYAPNETVIRIKPRQKGNRNRHPPSQFARRKSWGTLAQEGEADQKHKKKKKQLGNTHHYEHGDYFVECPDPCKKMLEIELVGNVKMFRMDGRAIRDVVGCCRIDISHLKIRNGEESKTVGADVYKPRLRANEHGHAGEYLGDTSKMKKMGKAPKKAACGSDHEKRPHRILSSISRRSNISDEPHHHRAVVDEDDFAEPSDELVGRIVFHMKRGLQEQSRKLGDDEEEDEIPWDMLGDLGNLDNPYIFDECIEVLSSLVTEHHEQREGTRDSADPLKVDIIWEKMDWQTVGLVSLGRIERFIQNDFTAMVDNEILMCVYQSLYTTEINVVPTPSRRSWVDVEHFLELLCCQLNFKRIFTALEDVPHSPLAWEQPPSLITIRVDKRQFAYLLKRSAMALNDDEFDEMWSQCDPNDANDSTILLHTGCRMATEKRFWPKQYRKRINQIIKATAGGVRAKARMQQKKVRQKDSLQTARRETGYSDHPGKDAKPKGGNGRGNGGKTGGKGRRK